MWRILALIVSPFVLAASVLFLRERRVRKARSRRDRLDRFLADRGFVAQPPSSNARERVGRYLRAGAPADSPGPAAVRIADDGGPPLRVEISVGGAEVHVFLATRGDLAELLAARPEVLEGDFRNIRSFVGRSGERAGAVEPMR